MAGTEDRSIERLARHLLQTKRGVGMIPPFYAETASVKGNLEWPYWIVRNRFCNSLGSVMARADAEMLTRAMNDAAEGRDQ